jgi:hypothetical protein
MADTVGTGTTVQGNHSGQWGLASILLGGLVLMLFPLLLMALYASLMGMYWDDQHQSRDVDLGVTTLYVLFFGLLGVAGFAVLCALVGLLSALFRRQSFGLSLAGLVTAALAVAAAGLLGIAGLRSVEWARAYQKDNYGPDGKKIPNINRPVVPPGIHLRP